MQYCFVKGKCLMQDIATFFFFFFCVACGILVPQPGTKPAPPALEAQSFKHWTTREVPRYCYFIIILS